MSVTYHRAISACWKNALDTKRNKTNYRLRSRNIILLYHELPFSSSRLVLVFVKTLQYRQKKRTANAALPLRHPICEVGSMLTVRRRFPKGIQRSGFQAPFVHRTVYQCPLFIRRDISSFPPWHARRRSYAKAKYLHNLHTMSRGRHDCILRTRTLTCYHRESMEPGGQNGGHSPSHLEKKMLTSSHSVALRRQFWTQASDVRVP
jgi:hypothetical protein